MSSLGIPANLQAACGEVGIINLSWEDAAPTCDPYFSISSGAIDEITGSSSKTWVLNNSLGNIFWEVSGTGASINQSGIVTTTAAACGTLTITATDSCCGVYTQQVRVTDAGTWLYIDQASCGNKTLGNSPQYCPYPGGLLSYGSVSCVIITGGTKKEYGATCFYANYDAYGGVVCCEGIAVTYPCSHTCTVGYKTFITNYITTWEWRCP